MATDEAHGVARYIVDQLKNVETLKLQKLMYYCNGWSLAILDDPLFEDEIQAWAHGPVVTSIYPHHAGQVAVTEWPWGASGALTRDQERVCDAVIKSLGKKSGWALRELSHEEDAWLNAYDQGRNTVITEEAMRADFDEKAEAAKRRALKRRRASGLES